MTPMSTRLARRCAGLALAAGCLAGAMAQAAPLQVFHQGREDSADVRRQYDWLLLRAALEKTRKKYGDYTVGPGGMFSHAEVLTEMINPNGKINVMTRGTTTELESALLPIRIPIDRGVLGYRVLLVRQADLDQFKAVRTVSDLRRFTFLQGNGWIDARVLSAGSLTVRLGPYETLFGELASQGGDAFPRGVAEAAQEIEQRRGSYPTLAIEPHLLLCYPMARYFFVRRDADGRLLARRIEAGLEMMLADGSMVQLFDQSVGPLLRQMRLAERHVIDLGNPFLPPQTPLARKALWYGQGRDRSIETPRCPQFK